MTKIATKNFFRKAFKFSANLLLITVLLFSNFVSFLPQSFQDNKIAENFKVNEAFAAIAIRATGAYVNGTANLTPVIPAGSVAGDMMILAYGTKPFNDAPTIDQGWTSIGSATDGTVVDGVDVGSMQTRLYYKIHTGTETNPTVTNGTNNISGAVIIVFQKSASEAWDTPMGAGGGDATAGTGFSVTASANPGITAGDLLIGYAAIRSDAGTQSAITITATGATMGAFTESPADLVTTGGGDMAMSGGYAAVSSGTASASPVYASTLAVAHTGSAFIVRLRVLPLTTLVDGTNPASLTLAPGASALVNAFTFIASSGTDTVTGATVSLSPGAGNWINTVAITNNGDTITYCSATPGTNFAVLTGCAIPVTITPTQFKVKITAIPHGSMPVPPGASYVTLATITGFTSTNPQAGTDGGSGDTFTKLSNPDVFPTGDGRGTSISSDGIYLAVTHLVAPFVTIYKRTGDTFTKLGTPILADQPTNNSFYNPSFSADGTYLSIPSTAIPYVLIYKRTGDTFNKLSDPATIPAGGVYATSLSPDGTYLAVSHAITPFITIYKRSGDTFTKLTPDPSSLPTGIGRGISFSHDGTYLSIAHEVSPFVTIYKRTGDTFNKLTDPAILPTGIGRGSSFSPDGTYLAIGHDVTPFVSIYKRTAGTDTFVKLPNPTTLPAGATWGSSFSPDGVYLALSEAITPFLSRYKREGDTFTKLANLTALEGITRGASFSPDGVYLSLSHDVSPRVAIYKTSTTNTVVTIDNQSPVGTTGATATAGNAQVTANWINPSSELGVTWTSRTSAEDNNWRSVTYGNGLFVAVANTGTGNRVMTSPDGVTWTIRTSAADNQWYSVTYGNGLFVAVSIDGANNQVMTSPDGITWTTRTPATSNQWVSVTYGNGLFVAVSFSSVGNRVMTSPDGITWTTRTSAADNQWYSVTYGNGLFVAVSIDGLINSVMTSPDGITWTIRTSAVDNQWSSVTYGNGLFVAVANTGTDNQVMTSPDGINWTTRTSAANNPWLSVTYGDGLFVAVSSGGAGNRVMTSPDGITWTIKASAANNAWHSVTYGNGLFVAVSNTGVGNRVMTYPDVNIVILRDTATLPIGVAPTEGSSPTVGSLCNAGTANCILRYNGFGQTFVDTGLANGTTYYYRIFVKDLNGNYTVYSATQEVSATPVGVANTTTIDDGVNPGATTLAPGGVATMIDSFTFVTSAGSDSLTAVTTTFTAGTAVGVGLLEITNDAGSTVYGSIANPTDVQAITLTTALPVGTASTQFKIRITPKTHSAMPVPPGGSYAVTARITAWTGTNTQAGTDGASATITIDNLSPAGTTLLTPTVGNAQVSLAWSNPGDADFQQVYIYCKTATMGSGEAPTEGADPAVDATACDGTARMKYKGTASPQSITGLTNGTLYFFRVYARDTSGNYTAHVSTEEVSATPTGVVNKAATSTLTSSIFDTGVTFGAAYNSIMWKGLLPAGPKVRFQFSVSNDLSLTWNYFGGNSCGALDWFDPLGPDLAIELKCPTQFNNKRYFRYKIQLCSSANCTDPSPDTPRVTDIIVNWVP